MSVEVKDPFEEWLELMVWHLNELIPERKMIIEVIREYKEDLPLFFKGKWEPYDMALELFDLSAWKLFPKSKEASRRQLNMVLFGEKK